MRALWSAFFLPSLPMGSSSGPCHRTEVALQKDLLESISVLRPWPTPSLSSRLCASAGQVHELLGRQALPEQGSNGGQSAEAARARSLLRVQEMVSGAWVFSGWVIRSSEARSSGGSTYRGCPQPTSSPSQTAPSAQGPRTLLLSVVQAATTSRWRWPWRGVGFLPAPH